MTRRSGSEQTAIRIGRDEHAATKPTGDQFEDFVLSIAVTLDDYGRDEKQRVALDQPLPVAVEMLEPLMVRRALDRTHGRVEEASRLLGISRKGLFLKRRRWGFGQAS
jgi:DNA-binding NtrC family response regulator